MVEYISVASVDLFKESIEKCSKFAELCVDTNLDEYKRRRQFNRAKITDDIKTGKMAEIAVFDFLTGKNFKCNEPDFEIYTARKKNFNQDLIAVKDDKTWHIHVKSQKSEQADKYGISWMFQKKDKLITKPKEEDVIVLCIVTACTVNVIGAHYAKDIVDIYGEPKLKHLTSKAALYYDDINRKNSENQCFLREMGIE